MGLESITNGLNKIFKSSVEYWKNLEKSRRIQLIAVTILILAISLTAVTLLNRKTYTVLYTNLTPGDAGEILEKLSEMRIDAKPQGSDTILVPSDLVDLTRMELAAQGFPKSSSNLDILQRGTGFGVTEEDKAIYRRYQLQEDLQNAIKTFSSIDDARVALFIPRESVFVIENQSLQATASVLINIKSGQTLSPGNVKAISELVQKSVPNLKAENVSVIDSNMNLLSVQQDLDERVILDQIHMQEHVSNRLARQVTDLLQPVFGIGNVMTTVNAVLNFDENIIDSIRFEPLEDTTKGIIANIDTIREISRNTITEGGEAGTGNNAGGIPVYPVMETEDIVYEKNSERIVYEINTIKEHLHKAKGTIEKLSVSVVLDSNTTAGQNYTESVVNIISNAIGVDPEFITVENLPFNGVNQLTDTWEDYNQLVLRAQQVENLRFIAVYAAAIIFALIIFIVLIKKGKPKNKQEAVNQMFPSLDRNGVQKKSQKTINPEDFIESINESLAEDLEPYIETKKDIQRSSAEKNIERNPELAATIIKSWLAEDEE